MGDLIRQDIEYHRKYFNESAKLLGIKVKYYSVSKSKSNIYDDKDIHYNDPMLLDIHFEQYPKIKTLKKIGWYKENDTELPIIAYIPYDTPFLSKNSKIEFEHDLGELRSFEVSEITTDYSFPIYWILKLVPIFNDSTVHKDKEGTPNYVPQDESKVGQYKPKLTKSSR